MLDSGDEIAKRFSPDQREAFQKYWNSMMTDENLASIELSAKHSMSKHMTASELNAFVQFVSNPAGKSAMEKMKFYIADITPLMQRLMQRSLAGYQKAQSAPK
jgi:uncharacterized protein (DUF2236 family)